MFSFLRLALLPILHSLLVEPRPHAKVWIMILVLGHLNLLVPAGFSSNPLQCRFAISLQYPCRYWKTGRGGLIKKPPKDSSLSGLCYDPYFACSTSSTCWLHKLANLHPNNGKPAKPTVNADLVILTYWERYPLVHPPLHQTAIHMKGVKTMLNI